MTDLSTVFPATSARANELRDRHLDFFLLLAERAGEQIRGTQQLQALRVLDEESDNIRAAIGWAQEQGEAEAVLRFIVALREYWPLRVPSEGLRWCRAAIEEMDIGDTDLVLRARAFVAAGWIARNALAHITDRRWMEEGIRLAREADDDLALARGLHVLGMMISLEEGPEKALEATREGLEAARRAKADVETGDLLRSLGTITYRLEGGVELVEEASELQRKIGDRIGLGWTLNWLAWHVDSPQESIERARELTSIAEELKDEAQLAGAYDLIAWAEAMHGDPPARP